MKRKNPSKTAAKAPFKMSLAVSLLSNIAAIIHFGLLVVLVLSVFNIISFINSVRNIPANNGLEHGIPAIISSELQKYRDFEKLSLEKYEVSTDSQNNQQIVKVKNLLKGETYMGIFTATEILPDEILSPSSSLGAYGILRETVTDSTGEIITEVGGQSIYNLSEISPFEHTGANGILLFQEAQFVNLVILIIIGFLASNKVYKFFKNIRQGAYFVSENVKFLRAAGVYALCGLILPMVMNFGLMILTTVREYNFGFGSIDTILSINWSLMLVSALLFMLSEILQRGSDLQIEKDMTI